MRPQLIINQGVLAQRVREIRRELFGENGEPVLADVLHLPTSTWTNYEAGVTIPGPVILRLIDVTGVSARWLLTGQGPRYGKRDRDADDLRGIA